MTSPLQASLNLPRAQGEWKTRAEPGCTSRQSLVDDLRRKMQKLEESNLRDEEPLSTGCAALDQLLPRGGLQRGTLVEWLAEQPGSGAGGLALLAARQACRDDKALVVMDRQRQFYPPAAVAWGYDLASMLVIRSSSEEDELWALDQALRCRGVGAVFAPLAQLDLRAFRRLQLAAENGGTLGLLLRPATIRGQPSWADLQIAVRPRASPAGRRLQVEIVRCRGGTAGRSIELEISDLTGMVQKVSASHEPDQQTHPLPPAAELARATG